MAKISINKPTGSVDTLNLVSAFNDNGKVYVILDSGKLGSMGLPIIYVCKFTDKLESINDENEWNNVKNYLRGIINGTQMKYVKIDENVSGDEIYYKQLTLPEASFELIKSKYIVNDNESNPVLEPIPPVENNESISSVESMAPISPMEPIQPTIEPVVISNESIAPIEPIIPNNNVVSNNEIANIPVKNVIERAPVMPTIEPVSASPVVEPIAPLSPVEPIQLETTNVIPMQDETIAEEKMQIEDNTFLTDKETF